MMMMMMFTESHPVFSPSVYVHFDHNDYSDYSDDDVDDDDYVYRITPLNFFFTL